MSLKKKIILTFFISAFLIAILAVFEFINFNSIKQEIRFLELTDTVRSKSLQLRRHEKNFFLYSPRASDDEAKAIYQYLDDLDSILADLLAGGANDSLRRLRQNVVEYRNTFHSIEARLTDLGAGLRGVAGNGSSARFFPLLEAAIYERPHQAAEFLRRVYGLSPGHRLITGLEQLDREIGALRKNGEDVITNAKDLDRAARENVESGIRTSQAAIVIVFPVFLVTGIAMLFVISRSVVSRLRLLIDVMEKSRAGTFEHVKAPVRSWGNDEVGQLIRKFDDMEDELEERQALIEQKNQELLQSKKLAAIGTLAAGVAHELNNPLNNIYLSTQVLVRELGTAAAPSVREVTGDILGQTARVKTIVGDLLEFARGREPQFADVEITSLIRDAFNRVRSAAAQVAFSLDSPGETVLAADPDQMERVFINLFTNASQAMDGRGELRVTVTPTDGSVTISVSDTGRGMTPEAAEKIFEPFYSTREKGTGLGLAIVYNIVKKHHGDIVVNSAEGKGAIFMITLPKKTEPTTR
ncbi:MAG: ATP-binding protein [Nitrospiraceae bacterium]|nr:ATP-binding protein [Nitrospiraceae bacterium]